MGDVLPTNEARARLNQIAATFDRVGVAGAPITFGSYRRPQAVIVPWELWRQLVPVIEDVLDVATARTRLENADPQRIDHSDVLVTLDEVRANPGS